MPLFPCCQETGSADICYGAIQNASVLLCTFTGKIDTQRHKTSCAWGVPRTHAKVGAHEGFAHVGRPGPRAFDFMAVPLKAAHGQFAMLLHSKIHAPCRTTIRGKTVGAWKFCASFRLSRRCEEIAHLSVLLCSYIHSKTFPFDRATVSGINFQS